MSDDLERRRAGAVIGLIAYIVWGLLTMYWKLLNGFDTFELVGWRIMSAAAIMAGAMTVSRRWTRLTVVLQDRALLGRIAIAAALLTCNWCAFVWAVVHGHVIETALGYFIAPLGTMAIGMVAFGERLDRSQRIAIGFAVIAVMVLVVSYGEMPYVALILALSWSVYGGMKKRVPLTVIESMSAETFVLLLPAVVVSVVLAGRAGSIPSSAGAGELVLVLLTGVATVVPLTMFAWAAHRLPLTVLGPMQYLIPSTNFVLGWLVYHEDLPASRVAGFALVWVGLAVMTAGTVHRRTRQGPSPELVHTVPD